MTRCVPEGGPRQPCLLVLAIALLGGTAGATPQDGVLEEYLSHQAARPAALAEVETRIGRSFAAFSDQDYARFMGIAVLLVGPRS